MNKFCLLLAVVLMCGCENDQQAEARLDRAAKHSNYSWKLTVEQSEYGEVYCGQIDSNTDRFTLQVECKGNIPAALDPLSEWLETPKVTIAGTEK